MKFESQVLYEVIIIDYLLPSAKKRIYKDEKIEWYGEEHISIHTHR